MSLIKSVFAATNTTDGVDISKLYNPATKIPIGGTLTSLFTGDLLTLIFVIIGLLFFANLVIAGWEYMMSSGDPKKVAGATTRFMNGFFGLVMSFTAYLVVRVVLSFLNLSSLI